MDAIVRDLKVLAPIDLPPPLREIPFNLLVLWDDGSPVAGTEIRIEDVTGAYSRLVLAVNTDEHGRLKAVGRESREYVAEAILGRQLPRRTQPPTSKSGSPNLQSPTSKRSTPNWELAV